VEQYKIANSNNLNASGQSYDNEHTFAEEKSIKNQNTKGLICRRCCLAIVCVNED